MHTHLLRSQVAELTELLQDKLGVSGMPAFGGGFGGVGGAPAAGPAGGGGGAAAAAAAPVEEQTEFSVKLEGYEAGEKLKVRERLRRGCAQRALVSTHKALPLSSHNTHSQFTQVIKELRGATGLGLKESKDLVSREWARTRQERRRFFSPSAENSPAPFSPLPTYSRPKSTRSSSRPA